MSERLAPPSGPWRKKYDQFGVKFLHDAGTDPVTGFQTTWEKSISETAEIITVFNKHPNGLTERSIIEGNNVTGRHIIYIIKDETERHQYMHLVYAEDKFQSFSISTSLEEAQRPRFLNIVCVCAVYAVDGAMSSLRIYVDSQSHFNEDEFRTRSIEDNIRELAEVFKSGGEQADSPLVANPDHKDEKTWVDMHESIVGSLIRGKLMQWSEAEKGMVDEDLSIIPDVIAQVCEGSMTAKQITAMANFLATETVKALPEDYSKLEGEERDDRFAKAFEEAMFQSFRFHDHSLRALAQYTVMFAPSYSEQGKYLFMVFQGYPLSPLGDDKPKQALAAATSGVGYAYPYEDKQFGLMRFEDYLAVLISSRFNKNDKVLYLTPERLHMDELIPLVKTDHPPEWQRAFEVTKVRLQVIPSED